MESTRQSEEIFFKDLFSSFYFIQVQNMLPADMSSIVINADPHPDPDVFRESDPVFLQGRIRINSAQFRNRGASNKNIKFLAFKTKLLLR